MFEVGRWSMSFWRTVMSEVHLPFSSVLFSHTRFAFALLPCPIHTYIQEKGLKNAWTKLHQEIIKRPEEMMKLLVPGT